MYHDFKIGDTYQFPDGREGYVIDYEKNRIRVAVPSVTFDGVPNEEWLWVDIK